MRALHLQGLHHPSKMAMAMAMTHLNLRGQNWQLCPTSTRNYVSTQTEPKTSYSSSSCSCDVAPAAVAVAPAPAPAPAAVAVAPSSSSKKMKNKTRTTPPPPTAKAKSLKDYSDEMKLNWLSSLSLTTSSSSSEWIIGIDPDVSGALALFKPTLHSPQVFDSPHLKVLVGKRARRRLDPKAIIQLLQSFHAPQGTIAYLEQSLPFPQDGKQGWWSGGFNYGLWIGALVSLGFSVVPVPSLLWKNQFKLSGNGSNKDASREAACTLFPSISSQLKRKKDHGRAEALLIAAYGKSLQMSSSPPPSLVSEEDRMP